MAVETLLNALPWIVGGLILILLLAALRIIIKAHENVKVTPHN